MFVNIFIMEIKCYYYYYYYYYYKPPPQGLCRGEGPGGSLGTGLLKNRSSNDIFAGQRSCVSRHFDSVLFGKPQQAKQHRSADEVVFVGQKRVKELRLSGLQQWQGF